MITKPKCNSHDRVSTVFTKIGLRSVRKITNQLCQERNEIYSHRVILDLVYNGVEGEKGRIQSLTSFSFKCLSRALRTMSVI